MGTSPASMIQAAGQYVISRLLERNPLPYSTFYDGRDETHEEIRAALGLDDDWYCAEHLIDLAVFQLEEQEILTIEQLDSQLADGEDDYLIELLPEGRARLLAGFEPTYRHME